MSRPGWMCTAVAAAVLAVPSGPGLPGLRAASITTREVVTILREGPPTNLAGLDLSRLDLAGLDLSGADLTGASLFGADLTGARLVGAKLAGADLNRAILIRADFTGADLTGATMILPAASTRLGENPASEAPRFIRANLTGARVLAKFGNSDWTGAVLVDARFALGDLQFLAAAQSDLSGAKLGGANLAGADLHGVILPFADLRGANLRGTNLHGADLAGALLDGADLTGADLTRADLHHAALTGAVGLDRAIGLQAARNVPRATARAEQ